MSRLEVGQRMWFEAPGKMRSDTIVSVSRKWAMTASGERVTAEPTERGTYGRDRGARFGLDAVYTDTQRVHLEHFATLRDARRCAANKLTMLLDPQVILAVCALLDVPCPPLRADADVLADLLAAEAANNPGDAWR